MGPWKVEDLDSLKPGVMETINFGLMTAISLHKQVD